jgi:peptidoglycan/LPS O-acetylase OafA/YrhL
MSTDARARASQIGALTSIRFFLAFGVVGGHFIGHFYPISFQEWPTFFFHTAPYAVSWFFMLSGYIIAYNYPTLPTHRDRLHFMALRVARIWPVHFVTLIAAIFILGRGRRIDLLGHLTLTQTWSASPYIGGAYNGPSWSVSDELYFYLIYAGLMLPIRWLRAPLVVVPMALAFFLAWSHGCYTPGTPFDAFCSTYIQMFPPARLVEFLAGVALFHLKLRVPQTLGLVAAFCVLGGFEPSLPKATDTLFWHFAYQQAVVIICGGALIASLARDGWLSRALTNRPLILGGEISYSMYMTHQLVMIALLPRMTDFSLPLQFAIVCGLVLGISLLLFHIVEKPARDSVKQWLRRRRGMSEPPANAEVVELPATVLARADEVIK